MEIKVETKDTGAADENKSDLCGATTRSLLYVTEIKNMQTNINSLPQLGFPQFVAIFFRNVWMVNPPEDTQR